MSDLVESTCIGCGQTDDHPRHRIDVGNGLEVGWHMDCHANSQKCEACTESTKNAAGATGDALREHLVNGANN